MNIKAKILSIIVIMTFSISSYTQEYISIANINQKYLEHLIKDGVDSVRKAHNCQALINDSILYVASLHHSNYMVKNRLLSHYENVDSTRTPQLRAEEYGAINYSVGENVLYTSFVDEIKLNIKRDTYLGLAKKIVLAWVHSPKHYKNIISPEYQITGLSIAIDKEKKILYACQNFARVQYNYHFIENHSFFSYASYQEEEIVNSFDAVTKTLTQHTHAWDLKHDSFEKCNKCKATIKNSPEKSLNYKNKNFILRIENSDYVKQLIQNKDDGFAIEIVGFDDYICENPQYYTKPSRRNGQCRLNGTILKPLYREDLYKGYKKRKLKKNIRFLSYIFGADSVTFFDRFRRYKIEKYSSAYFEIKMGKLPKSISGYWGANLVYLKNKQICHIDYFNNYLGELFEDYETPKFIPLDTSSNYIFKLDTQQLSFKIPFEKDKFIYSKKDIEPFLESITQLNYTLDSVNIKAFSSVEGDSITNKKLQIRRANSIIKALEPSETTVVNIEVLSAWELFYNSIKKSKKWRYLGSYKKEKLQKLINEHYSDSLEYILNKERYVQIQLYCSIDLTDDNLEYYIKKNQDELIDTINKLDEDSKDIEYLMSEYQHLYEYVHKLVIEKRVDTNTLVKMKLPEHINIKNTEEYILYGYQFYDAFKENEEWMQNRMPISKKLIKTGMINLSNEFLYNDCRIRTEQLKEKKYVTQVEVQKLFNQMDYLSKFYNKSNTAKINLDKLALNLNLILLNKVFDKDKEEKSEEAKSSIYQIKKIYIRANKMNSKTALKLAQTAVYYNNIELALLLLYPYIKEDSIWSFAVPLEYYHNSFDAQGGFYDRLIESSNNRNIDLWCNLFLAKYKIPFQAFDNEKLRNIFCEKCMMKNKFLQDIFSGVK